MKLDDYYADFERHFWHVREFWKLERGQTFAEPGDASGEAFNAGGWAESMCRLEARRADLVSYHRGSVRGRCGDRLSHLLDSAEIGGPQAVIVIAGVGKTALALHWMHRIRENLGVVARLRQGLLKEKRTRRQHRDNQSDCRIRRGGDVDARR